MRIEDILSIIPQWLAIGVSLIAVIATLVLGFIAIFGDRIRAFIFKPKVRLSFKLALPYSHKVPWGSGGILKCYSYYLRVKVENVGKASLEDVEVMLADVKKKIKKVNMWIPSISFPCFYNGHIILG